MERRKVCLFCNQDEENELLYGKIHELDDIVTHYFCLLLSSNMEQNGGDNDGILGFLREDILKEYRRGRRLICWYCKRSGATLGCCVSRCKKVFHLPCGRREGSLHQFFGQFKSFCAAHRPVQKIDPQVIKEVMTREATCAICYDDVQPTNCHSTLWAPCCRINAWFHRDCVQKLAVSAGYFFKCPLCNNNTTFQKAMLDFGIYIPEQDASWELVPNAFQELLHRHDRCDAKHCLCPKGRFHTLDGTRWELVLCRYCGSRGIHVGCGPLKWSNPEWQCEECKTMLEQAQKRGDTDDENEPDPSPSSVTEPPPRRKRRYYGRSGESRKPRCRNHRVDAPSLGVSTSSSQSPRTPESQSSATAVIEISDDDVIEILDDDNNELPVKRPPQDNCNTVLSSDGVLIPVVKLQSIPVSNERENFSVVGDLNVKVPHEVNSTLQNEQTSVMQAHSLVSQVTALNRGGEASRPASISGASSSGSSVEDNTPLFSTSAVSHSDQLPGSAAATRGSCVLQSYLMSEGAQRGRPHTNRVSAVVQQAASQPLVRTTSVPAKRKWDQNPDSTSSTQQSAARTVPYDAAVAASNRSCDRPYRVRSDRRQNRSRGATDISVQRESRHSVHRLTRSSSLHNDLQFRVTGPNSLQVGFFNRYVVNFDLPLPCISRPVRKTGIESASSVLQNEATANSNSIDSSQRDSLLRNPAKSTRYCVQEASLGYSSLHCLAHPSSRNDSVSHDSTMSEKSVEDKVAEVKTNRAPIICVTHKQERSSISSQIVGVSTADYNTKRSRSTGDRNASLSEYLADPIAAVRQQSPVLTRSRSEGTCLKFQHINGHQQQFSSAVSELEPDLFNRRIRQSRSTLQFSQDPDAPCSEIQKASASQSENEVVGTFCEVSRVDAVLEQDMIDFYLLKNGNVVAPQVEICSIYASQPYCKARNGLCDSNIGSKCGDILHIEGVDHDSCTESKVDDSHAESGMGGSHKRSEGDDFHSENRVDSHIESTESRVSDFRAESGTTESHIGHTAGDFHMESRVGDLLAESGIHDFHEEKVGDSHAENVAGCPHSCIGTRDSCSGNEISEYSFSKGQIEGDLHSLYMAADSQSEAEFLDVCQSSGRENALFNSKLDVSVASGLQSEEENKSQVQKKWRHRYSSSDRGHFVVRSFSPVLTRSKSRLVLRNKKCTVWRFPKYEYSHLSHRARSRSRKENRKVSRQKGSCRDIFVQNKVTKNFVARNERKLPSTDSTSIAFSPVVKERYKSVDICGQSPWKEQNKSCSWNGNTEQSAIENASNSLVFSSKCKDNMQTEGNTVVTQECVTEKLDNPTGDVSGVMAVSNGSGGTGQDLHSDGMMRCSRVTTGVDQILLNGRILNHQPFSEVCMNDVVKIKAKALTARKFRPPSAAEILQRTMMKQLQSLYNFFKS